MTGRVLNLRDFRGRALPDDVVRIDRKTKWGNPYSHLNHSAAKFKVGTRDEAITAYRSWLTEVLSADPLWLEPLRGKRLICWCSPLSCHGEVILDLLGAGPPLED